MFVCSFKTSKKELLILILGILVFIGSIVFAFWPKDARIVSAPLGGTACTAETSEQRISFLKTFGWEINANPTEVREIIIPLEFTDVYTNYNDIQKKQGFDLEQYKGKRVKLWTYEVKNYPNQPDVYANMLIYDGNVIGGDICSVELSGFMHGFNKPDGDIKQTNLSENAREATDINSALSI